MKRLRLFLVFLVAFASLTGAKADQLFTTGRLFKIEAPGVAPSYLLGTIHVSDPKVLALPPRTKAAFSISERLALEIDFSKVSLAELLTSAILPAGESLSARLGAARFGELVERLAPYGVTAPVADRLQPWLLLATLAQPPEEIGKQPLDLHLDHLARQMGKEVIGLEAIEEQLRLVRDLPRWLQISLLVEVMHLPPQALMEDRDRLLALYLAGDLAGLEETLRKEMGEGFFGWISWQKLIVERNRRMAERAMPLIEEGGTFIAVGIGHLGGEEGLLQLFSEAGFSVSAVQ